jgi:hypothetical protein
MGEVMIMIILNIAMIIKKSIIFVLIGRISLNMLLT